MFYIYLLISSALFFSWADEAKDTEGGRKILNVFAIMFALFLLYIMWNSDFGDRIKMEREIRQEQKYEERYEQNDSKY